MDVSKNSGFSPQIIHFNRVFHYFHHPFWGYPCFGKHPYEHHKNIGLTLGVYDFFFLPAGRCKATGDCKSDAWIWRRKKHGLKHGGDVFFGGGRNVNFSWVFQGCKGFPSRFVIWDMEDVACIFCFLPKKLDGIFACLLPHFGSCCFLSP